MDNALDIAPMKTHNILPLIDELARLREQIAALEVLETKVKADLKTLGVGTHMTDHYLLTITESERATLDMDAVRDKLSDQFIRAHTKITKFLTLKTSRRTANGR
jgi:hypothetical protein